MGSYDDDRKEQESNVHIDQIDTESSRLLTSNVSHCYEGEGQHAKNADPYLSDSAENNLQKVRRASMHLSQKDFTEKQTRNFESNQIMLPLEKQERDELGEETSQGFAATVAILSPNSPKPSKQNKT